MAFEMVWAASSSCRRFEHHADPGRRRGPRRFDHAYASMSAHGVLVGPVLGAGHRRLGRQHGFGPRRAPSGPRPPFGAYAARQARHEHEALHLRGQHRRFRLRRKDRCL
eukprot:5477464-Pyramimonas_sp.AAC.1